MRDAGFDVCCVFMVLGPDSRFQTAPVVIGSLWHTVKNTVRNTVTSFSHAIRFLLVGGKLDACIFSLVFVSPIFKYAGYAGGGDSAGSCAEFN